METPASSPSEKPSVRLTVVLEFDTPQDCQEWLDEHKNGWCSDVPMWSSARLVSTSLSSDWRQTQFKPIPVPPGYVPIPDASALDRDR